jgi:hypothetical protein
MPEQRPREPSHPPSDPHPSLAGYAAGDRPARAQLIGAVLAGLLLVTAGLYLWRRPSMSAEAATGEAALAAASASAMAAIDAVAPFAAVADAGIAAPVSLSELRILGCHDKGPTKTAPDQCDHPGAMEQALSRAIEQSATCVPASTSSATIEYVADVSFSRRKVRLILPRAGRSVRDRKVVGACATAVRDVMQGAPFDGTDHQHARYKISVVATYRTKT